MTISTPRLCKLIFIITVIVYYVVQTYSGEITRSGNITVNVFPIIFLFGILAIVEAVEKLDRKI